MTEKEAIELIETEARPNGAEVGHEIADDILCKFLLSLGYQDLVKAYRSLEKWYA